MHKFDSPMLQTNHPELFDTGPALLGPPELNSYRALIVADKLPRLEPEEDEILGMAIYDGRLAAERLANPDISLEVDEYFDLEYKVEQGQAARQALASRYITLVIGMSRNFAYNRERQYDQERRNEMISVGNVALMQCMDKYIPIPGRTFAPFAATAVKNAMINEIMSSIRSNTGRSHRSQRILLEVDAAHRAAQKDSSDISFEEMAVKLGYTAERIQNILKLPGVWPEALDSPIILGKDPSDYVTIADTLDDPTALSDLHAIETQIALQQIWDTAKDLYRRQIFTAEEWKLFTARYEDGLTQQEIADQLDVAHTQSGVNAMEHRMLERIRNEIENPGYNDKKCGASLRIIESAVDLLEVLRIPISKETDILSLARNILDNIRLTAWQREVMQSLMGLNGHHFRPKELARLKERSHRAIYDAREKATDHIVRAWGEMTDEQKAATATIAPDEPNAVISRGPRPNTTKAAVEMPEPRKPKLTKAKILQDAVNAKSTGRLTKKDVAALADKGLLADLETIETNFRSWGEFQTLYRQLRQQLK